MAAFKAMRSTRALRGEMRGTGANAGCTSNKAATCSGRAPRLAGI
jgi:hypothetical protein